MKNREFEYKVFGISFVGIILLILIILTSCHGYNTEAPIKQYVVYSRDGIDTITARNLYHLDDTLLYYGDKPKYQSGFEGMIRYPQKVICIGEKK